MIEVREWLIVSAICAQPFSSFFNQGAFHASKKNIGRDSNFRFSAGSCSCTGTSSAIDQLPGPIDGRERQPRQSESIVNADISTSAAIAGTKIAPNFGAQNVATTGHASIGRASSGILSGAAKYLTLSASENYSADKTAALELQGSSISSLVPVARIDFSSVSSSGAANIIDRSLSQRFITSQCCFSDRSIVLLENNRCYSAVDIARRIY